MRGMPKAKQTQKLVEDIRNNQFRLKGFKIKNSIKVVTP